MNLDIASSHSGPSSLVEIRLEASGHFTARLIGADQLHAMAPTREEAVEQLRTLIRQQLDSGSLAWVEVPRDNPLLRLFGHANGDPTFDEYLEEIRKFREEMDRRDNLGSGQAECSDTSSTPSA